MAKKQKFMTLNATGAQGTNIDLDKYEAMKRALLTVIPADDTGVPFKELPDLVAPLLPDLGFPPEASITWYVTTVKLDLEARFLIERVPGAKPQHVRRPRGA